MIIESATYLSGLASVKFQPGLKLKHSRILNLINKNRVCYGEVSKYGVFIWF